MKPNKDKAIAEEWRPVVGYEGKYEVSNTGMVKSIERIVSAPYGQRVVDERILKSCNNGKGYLSVTLCDGPKTKSCLVHVLVLEAFDCPRPYGYECRHLDGTRDNNCIANLKWGTPKENSGDRRVHGTAVFGVTAYGAAFNEKDIIDIRKRYKRRCRKNGAAAISRDYGVSKNCIENVVNGDTYKEVISYE